MRQIVLDTETTGLEPELGHRIIEIGGVEMINRKLTGRHYHQYINPQRDIDDGAFEVHGISQEFLADKPLFAEISQEFLDFVQGAELVIHNAPFDVGFLNHEFARLGNKSKIIKLEMVCEIKDSLALARKKHPGQKNNLDALCRRYEVDNSQRDLHGALLDAEILADVFLLLTGGQTSLFGQAANEQGDQQSGEELVQAIDREGLALKVVRAADEELEAHQTLLDFIGENGSEPLWQKSG